MVQVWDKSCTDSLVSLADDAVEMEMSKPEEATSTTCLVHPGETVLWRVFVDDAADMDQELVGAKREGRVIHITLLLREVAGEG